MSSSGVGRRGQEVGWRCQGAFPPGVMSAVEKKRIDYEDGDDLRWDPLTLAPRERGDEKSHMGEIPYG